MVLLATRQTFDAGDWVTPEVVMPDDATRYTLRVGRGSGATLWPTRPGQPVVAVRPEVWTRGVWTPYGGCGLFGGEVLGMPTDRTAIATESTLSLWLPVATGRRVRARIQALERIETQLDVDFLTLARPPISRRTTNSVSYQAGADSAVGTAVSFVETAAFEPAENRRFLLGHGHNGDGTVAAYTSISNSLDGNLTQAYSLVFSAFERMSGAWMKMPSAASMTVRYTVAASQTYMVAGAMAFADVDQTLPFTNFEVRSLTTANPSEAILSRAGDMVAQHIVVDAAAIAVSGDGLSRAEEENYGADGFCQGLSTAPGASLVNLGWTVTPSTYGCGLASVNLRQHEGTALTRTGVRSRRRTRYPL